MALMIDEYYISLINYYVTLKRNMLRNVQIHAHTNQQSLYQDTKDNNHLLNAPEEPDKRILYNNPDITEK